MWKSSKTKKGPRSTVLAEVQLVPRWQWLSVSWFVEFSSSCKMMLEDDTLAPWSKLTKLITNAQINCFHKLDSFFSSSMAERRAMIYGPIIYVVSLLEPSYLFLCAWNIEHYECDLRIELTLTGFGGKATRHETLSL